jgi:DNA (cytosine-5)-methyltransferase 1
MKIMNSMKSNNEAVDENEYCLHSPQESFLDLGYEDWRERHFCRPHAVIRVGSLFSGIGAIEHALLRLNLNTKFACCVIDPNKSEATLQIQTLMERIGTITSVVRCKTVFTPLTWLSVGSPCQAFSMVGKRLGLEDTRGTLFLEFARVVSESQPKLIIY